MAEGRIGTDEEPLLEMLTRKDHEESSSGEGSLSGPVEIGCWAADLY
jgi:hypothetical protein